MGVDQEVETSDHRRRYRGAVLPAAIAVQQLFGAAADTVIHLVTGTGFLIAAASVFDFDLPRWVNIVEPSLRARSV